MTRCLDIGYIYIYIYIPRVSNVYASSTYINTFVKKKKISTHVCLSILRVYRGSLFWGWGTTSRSARCQKEHAPSHRDLPKSWNQYALSQRDLPKAWNQYAPSQRDLPKSWNQYVHLVIGISQIHGINMCSIMCT